MNDRPMTNRPWLVLTMDDGELCAWYTKRQCVEWVRERLGADVPCHRTSPGFYEMQGDAPTVYSITTPGIARLHGWDVEL